jgi:uncharacterized membrane protein (UPF0182 family)
MDVDLTTALMKVFGAAPAGSGTATSTPAPGVAVGTPAEIAQASDLYAKAIAAQKAGDWAAYGRYIKELGSVLSKLAGSKTTTATP